MSFTYIMGLLGGLALFLYGMQMMSDGLESAAGNKMKTILEKLTANRFVGVFMGALITAIIQSSSATTVMVVGFVNSGMMTLRQAVWIIMGANIGTTITGQLIALDVGELAPLIAFLGVAAMVFVKNEKVKYVGKIFAGLGILFIGMDMMGTAMKPLAQSEGFVGVLTKFENPILGIIAGAVFTAIIQSSSASVGILQALAGSGAIGLSGAAFVLFGQNIGTCITALLASVGTSRNAKRTTVIHIMFNVFGTIVFTVLCLLTPLTAMIEGLTPGDAPKQIANLHTLFNIVTTLLLLPVGGVLPKIATFSLKEKEENDCTVKTYHLVDIRHINADKLGASIICMESIKKELMRMLDMAKDNVHNAFDVFSKRDEEKHKDISSKEEYVDYLNKEISKYITTAVTYEGTKTGSQIFNSLYKMCSNIERISDHAINIADYSKMIEEKKIVFSTQAQAEIVELQKICDKLFMVLLEKNEDVIGWHERIACMEQKMDDVTALYRNNMFARIEAGVCSDEGSVLFSEMLTDFERIGDHALNISKEIVNISINER